MKNIAVGIEFTEAKGPVLRHANDLAKALGAALHVIHVVAPEPAFVGYATYAYPGPDERSEELAAEKAQLSELIDGLRDEDVDAHGYMRPGATVSTLLEFASDRRPG